MNDKFFEYKGYYGSCEICMDSKELFGKVLFIRDLITYAADTISELENEFRESVDDYLETCAELGKSPDKTLSGSFNVRLGSNLHKKIALEAISENVSQNEIIKKAVSFYFDEQCRAKEVHNHINVFTNTERKSEIHNFNESAKATFIPIEKTRAPH